MFSVDANVTYSCKLESDPSFLPCKQFLFKTVSIYSIYTGTREACFASGGLYQVATIYDHLPVFKPFCDLLSPASMQYLSHALCVVLFSAFIIYTYIDRSKQLLDVYVS